MKRDVAIHQEDDLLKKKKKRGKTEDDGEAHLSLIIFSLFLFLFFPLKSLYEINFEGLWGEGGCFC